MKPSQTESITSHLSTVSRRLFSPRSAFHRLMLSLPPFTASRRLLRLSTAPPPGGKLHKAFSPSPLLFALQLLLHCHFVQATSQASLATAASSPAIACHHRQPALALSRQQCSFSLPPFRFLFLSRAPIAAVRRWRHLHSPDYLLTSTT